MIFFEDIEDVQEWLDPLSYVAFWEATQMWAIFTDKDRAHCDQTISDEIAPQDTVLACMKAIARMELIRRFDLGPRALEPVDAQYVRTTH